jgi:hypothetical protein
MKPFLFTLTFSMLAIVSFAQLTVTKGGGLYLGTGAEFVIQGV